MPCTLCAGTWKLLQSTLHFKIESENPQHYLSFRFATDIVLFRSAGNGSATTRNGQQSLHPLLLDGLTLMILERCHAQIVMHTSTHNKRVRGVYGVRQQHLHDTSCRLDGKLHDISITTVCKL